MVSFVEKTMANKQIDMRKAKRIYKLYGEGDSNRRISKELGISCNTVAKYIEFFKCYRLTLYEVSEMTLEEIHRLFRADQKPKSEQLRTLERYFPYFDKELRKTGVTRQLLWEEYYAKHPDGFKLSQFRYWYREWTLIPKGRIVGKLISTNTPPNTSNTISHEPLMYPVK